MPYKEWFVFKPSGDACGRCLSMQGFYSKKPSKPHNACQCDISKDSGFCELEREETTRSFWNRHDEVVAVLATDSSATRSVTVTKSSSEKWEVGAEGGPFGGSVGGESGSSTSNTSSYTWDHSGECEGAEEVVAVYETYRIATLRKWSCVTIDWWETEYTYETKLADFYRRCI